jgi:hypothetical protein
MKKITCSILLFLSAICFSQTKLISHKSHSGSDENFRKALEGSLFDIGDSNLGVAPNRYERNANLDSVIYVSDNKVILVTSEHCRNVDRGDYKILDSNVWRAGRENVYNNPLFSKNHALDSIKNVLKEQYSFQNDINKTVFVGFDNDEKPMKKSKNKKKSLIPFFNSDTNFPSKPFLIFSLILLSSIVAFFSWKTSGFKAIVSN